MCQKQSLGTKNDSIKMSENNTTLEPNQSESARPRKAFLSPATIILLMLIAGAGAFFGFIGLQWNSHNNKIAKLKARSGDYVQLIKEEEEPDPVTTAPSNPDAKNGNSGNDQPRRVGRGQPPKKPAGPKPNPVQKWISQMLPAPVNVVYWRDPKLAPADVDFLVEFRDAEIMSISCESIDESTITRLLALPNIQRLRITSSSIPTENIKTWKIPEGLLNMTLVNPTWKGTDLDKIDKDASENKPLADKLNVTNSTGPSFGGV
jgi:hypothetical protein